MKELIAKDLLKIKAVFFRPEEPFTWASGIKSPVYCDNRLTLSDHQVRSDVENGLATLIKEHYPEAEVLMGTSTAGIAHAAITAHILGMPMGYVRSGAKDHGRQNQIEGKLEKGQKVVVVEDLISTGGSVLEVVNVLREAGAEVLGIVSIFTYGMNKGIERMAAANVVNYSLTDFDCVARVAGVSGRTISSGATVISNSAEQFADNVSNVFVNTASLKPVAGLKSVGNAAVTVGKGIFDIAQLAVNGTFGVLYEAADEIRYVIVPAYSNDSSLNPSEEITIVF